MKKILLFIINQQIKSGLWDHKDFKPGDIVYINWQARVMLGELSKPFWHKKLKVKDVTYHHVELTFENGTKINQADRLWNHFWINKE